MEFKNNPITWRILSYRDDLPRVPALYPRNRRRVQRLLSFVFCEENQLAQCTGLWDACTFSIFVFVSDIVHAIAPDFQCPIVVNCGRMSTSFLSVATQLSKLHTTGKDDGSLMVDDDDGNGSDGQWDDVLYATRQPQVFYPPIDDPTFTASEIVCDIVNIVLGEAARFEVMAHDQHIAYEQCYDDDGSKWELVVGGLCGFSVAEICKHSPKMHLGKMTEYYAFWDVEYYRQHEIPRYVPVDWRESDEQSMQHSFRRFRLSQDGMD